MMALIRNRIVPVVLLAWQSDAQLTVEYQPIDDLIRNHLRNTDTNIQIRNIQASSTSCYALFDNGHSVGTTQRTSETMDADEYLIPDRGIILSTGQPLDGNTNQSIQESTGGANDLESQILDNTVDIFDPCFIQFEFSCPIDAGRYSTNIDFRYVFGSEEYNSMKQEDVVNERSEAHPYNNDAFGVFLNGQNIALVPDGTVADGEDDRSILPVTINNINSKVNSDLFVYNPSHSEFQAGGYTTELKASGQVFPGWNSIKFVVGDAGDRHLDSWVFLKAGSFSCTRVEGAVDADPTATFPTAESVTNFPTESPSTEIELFESVPTESTPDEDEEEILWKSRFEMQTSMAVGLLVLIGLLALAIPLVAISFYDKKNGCGCGKKGERYGKPKKQPAKVEPKDKSDSKADDIETGRYIARTTIIVI